MSNLLTKTLLFIYLGISFSSDSVHGADGKEEVVRIGGVNLSPAASVGRVAEALKAAVARRKFGAILAVSEVDSLKGQAWQKYFEERTALVFERAKEDAAFASRAGAALSVLSLSLLSQTRFLSKSRGLAPLLMRGIAFGGSAYIAGKWGTLYAISGEGNPSFYVMHPALYNTMYPSAYRDSAAVQTAVLGSFRVALDLTTFYAVLDNGEKQEVASILDRAGLTSPRENERA